MAGSRGFGIFTYRYQNGELSFILQHRAVESTEEAPFTKGPLSLVSELHLSHCPWCGVKLKKFYNSTELIDRPDLKLT